MMFKFYAVRLGTTSLIVASEQNDLLLRNAINAGFKEEEIEILTQEEYEERKALEPKPTPPPSEMDLLRLEMARSNAEMFEMMISMTGGGM